MTPRVGLLIVEYARLHKALGLPADVEIVDVIPQPMHVHPVVAIKLRGEAMPECAYGGIHAEAPRVEGF